MKLNTVPKAILICLLILSGLVIFHRPILSAAGNHLAPTSNTKADVVILEGTEVVNNAAIDAGMRLLSDGSTRKMVIALHVPVNEEKQIFAIQNTYPRLITGELERLGLSKERIEVISVPVSGHPVTLKEAQFVVNKLSKDNVKSAVLLCEGFHTLRSFSVYQKEGSKSGIQIYPSSYFTEYTNDTWWNDTQGISDFLGESVKLVYYVLNGYVSLSSLIWSSGY